KPSSSRMRATSRQDSMRSLCNRDLDRGDVDLAVQAFGNLGRTRRLEEQLNGFLKVGARLLDRVALAGDIDLRTQRHEAIAFALDQRRQSSPFAHVHLPVRPSSSS